jgi:outer membrane protein assembly factor BamA
MGDNPQRFFLGGMMNWFNSRFDNNSGRVLLNIRDIYFSRFVTPLRGVGYYNQVGTRYILSNSEFRFPFIKHLLFGWPLPFYFRDIRGVLFSDVGTAWYTPGQIDGRIEDNSDEFEVPNITTGGKIIPSPKHWTAGFGCGIRLDLGIFPIEWDVAWSEATGMTPQYYFSLNYGF